MTAKTLEERLVALETEVTKLKEKAEVKRYGVTGKTSPDFLQNYTRKSANNPLFDEVARTLAEERERSNREAEQQAPEAPIEA